MNGMQKQGDSSIGLIVTDPTYGISFNLNEWDVDVPSLDVWREAYRVLKMGRYALIMSSARQDVLALMCKRIEDAGFTLSTSPMLWVYKSGFTKSTNISKVIDQRNGCSRVVIGKKKSGIGSGNTYAFGSDNKGGSDLVDISLPCSEDGIRLDGCYAGFQPKSTLEVIIVAFKGDIEPPTQYQEKQSQNISNTFVFIPKPSTSEKLTSEYGEKHPTMKPIDLMSYLINMYYVDGVVMDPFMGSGTTALACIKRDIKYIGFEREKTYYEYCMKRIEHFSKTLYRGNQQ